MPACAATEGTTIVTTLPPIFLLVQNLDRRVLSLLRHDPSPPDSDDGIAEGNQGSRISLVGQDVKEFNREAIQPNTPCGLLSPGSLRPPRP